jgi:hypothetical protein
MRRIALVLLLMTGGMWAAAGEPQGRAARDVIVKWRSLPSHLDALDLPNELLCKIETVKRALPETERTNSGLERISKITATSAENAKQLWDVLRSDPRVEYAELRPERVPHGFIQTRERESLDGVPNDPF